MEFAFYWGRLTLNKCNVIPGSCEGSGKKKNHRRRKERTSGSCYFKWQSDGDLL